jgi:predicted DNA-binding transcriptional regulator YafY
MPKRPDTRETVLLALELLKRIPRPGKISAPELHAQLANTGFARDLRTIQRQLDMLSQHFDIERDDRSKPYGYRWKERASGLTLPSLTPQEALLLALAQEHLRNLLPSSLMRSMAGFFVQANRMLGPSTKAEPESAWLNKVRVVSQMQPLIPPKILPKIFDVVSDALFRDELLDLEYCNALGSVVRARVMPLGIAQQGNRLYLVCRFERYSDERILALHRMRSAQSSGQHFQRPAFNLKRFEDDARFGFGDGKRTRLRFRIAKQEGAYLIESPLSDDQTCKSIGKELELTATVVESAQLIWWLRHFGKSAKILSPKRIARQL